MKSLFEILNFLDYQGSCPHDVRVSALKNHSQKIEPGDLFLAYPGHTADGRDYINHAIGSGAVACLVEADDVQSQAFYSVPVIKIPSLQKKVSELVSFFSDNPSSFLPSTHY